MKLLIVEDDLALSDVLAFTLRRAGFAITTAYDGEAGLAAWEQGAPDLIVLDLNLPKKDGLAVCRRIREHDRRTPIIILSVRGGDEAIVQSLELGADDYIVKPFSPAQLVARVRAVLRRTGVATAPEELTAGELTLDRTRSELRRGGEPPVRLTPLEARLAETLLLNAGHVLTVDTLIAAVWGADGGDRTMLKQLVYRLRSKIEPNPAEPRHIETVPGVGYAISR